MIHDQIRELDAAAAVLSFDQKLDLGICLPLPQAYAGSEGQPLSGFRLSRLPFVLTPS